MTQIIESKEDELKKEIEDMIKLCINDESLKKAVMEYLDKEFLNIEKISHNTLNKEIIAWIQLINSLKSIKISDLGWDHICNSHNLLEYESMKLLEVFYKNKKIEVKIESALKRLIYDNHKVGFLRFSVILHGFYRFLKDNTQYSKFKNLKEIDNYKHLLIKVYQSPKINLLENEEYKKIQQLIISNFPVTSKYVNFIQTQYNLISGEVAKINFNLNTSDNFIKNLMLDFISGYDKSKYLTCPELRIFLFYFEKSLEEYRLVNYDNLDEEIFKKQYYFYYNLEKKTNKLIKSSYNFRKILVAFYRFIIPRINNDSGNFTNQFKDAIYFKNFYKYYEKDFKFMYFSGFEAVPEVDKICVLPSNQTQLNANSYNNILVSLDFTIVNSEYKSIVKEFIWCSKGGILEKVKILNYVNDFLNSYRDYKKQSMKILNLHNNDNKKISSDFLYSYRKSLESGTFSNAYIRCVLKAVRKFLKFYSKEFNVTDYDLKILNLKGLQETSGGKIITQRDCNLIYNQFLTEEENDKNKRLNTIVFEIFMGSKLRIGEILNLKRNCLEKGEQAIEYISKTKNEEPKIAYVTKNVIALIEEAKSITSSYKNDEDIMTQYIFILPQRARHNNKYNRISFPWAFNLVVNKLEGQLDNKKYNVNNIRHTFINNVYKEGVKHNLSLQKIVEIAGNQYKTSKQYYRQEDDIDLYVETLSKTTISNVDIHGNILVNNNIEGGRPVKNDLGACKEHICIRDNAECLMCPHFVTFVNRIPEFEKRIAFINEKIENTENKLIINEFSNEKKLLALFLKKMLVALSSREEELLLADS